MHHNRDVVVTGLGALTPHGFGVQRSWHAIKNALSGITLLDSELVADLPVRVGGLVPDFDPQLLHGIEAIKPQDLKRLDRHAVFGIYAGLEAMQTSLDEHGMHPFEPERFGVSIGTSAGPVGIFQAATRAFDSGGARQVPPGAVIYGGSDSAAAYLSMRLQALGPGTGYGATCASGAVALGEAMRAIRHGYQDAVLVIGAEDCLNSVNLAANANIRSLAFGYETDPSAASRPFDEQRSGFVMSQGAAAILLENADHARTRGAKIFARMSGFGVTSDAYHATAPHPDGEGAARAIRQALTDAGLQPEDISHINTHGTATPLGDSAEVLALHSIFGSQIPVITATKSVTGHLLGAAGVFEAVIAIKSLEEQVVPPTLNLTKNEFQLDFVTGKARPQELKNVVSNSFGFGGHNAAIVFERLVE